MWYDDEEYSVWPNLTIIIPDKGQLIWLKYSKIGYEKEMGFTYYSRIYAINLANNLGCKSQIFYSGNYGDWFNILTIHFRKSRSSKRV